jgi:hypothetical protein
VIWQLLVPVKVRQGRGKAFGSEECKAMKVEYFEIVKKR